MDFCIKCKNFLFIKEKNQSLDDDTSDNTTPTEKIGNVVTNEPSNEIIYYCLKCDYQKPIINNCVYRKIYKKNTNLYKNHKFLNYDVTLPRKLITCPICKLCLLNVYYQCTNLSIIFICKNCSHFWNNN